MGISNGYDVQRAVIIKVGLPELWFLCSAHCLMVLYICVKFHVNISTQNGHEYMVEMAMFNVQRQ